MARLAAALAAVATLLLVSVSAAPAGTQTYAPPFVTVSGTTVVHGQTITISGGNCGPNAAVTLTITGSASLTTTADAAGNFSTPFTVPSDLALGTHTVTATDGTCVANTTFTVVSAGTAQAEGQPAGALPFTGTGHSIDYVRWALALVGVGGVLIAFGRHWWVRRRSAAAS